MGTLVEDVAVAMADAVDGWGGTVVYPSEHAIRAAINVILTRLREPSSALDDAVNQAMCDHFDCVCDEKEILRAIADHLEQV